MAVATARWRADSGRYVLELEVSVADGEFRVLARDEPPRKANAEDWFRRGVAAEGEDAERSRGAYERGLSLDPLHVAARLNLGRLLHESSQLDTAERVYRAGLLALVFEASGNQRGAIRHMAEYRRLARRGD